MHPCVPAFSILWRQAKLRTWNPEKPSCTLLRFCSRTKVSGLDIRGTSRWIWSFATSPRVCVCVCVRRSGGWSVSGCSYCLCPLPFHSFPFQYIQVDMECPDTPDSNNSSALRCGSDLLRENGLVPPPRHVSAGGVLNFTWTSSRCLEFFWSQPRRQCLRS